MGDRSKKHHYVPQLVLRRFATGQERIATVDLGDGRRYVQSVNDAAAENNYNTITTAEGDDSDAAEDFIALLEGEAAPCLERIAEGGWIESLEERDAVAMFLAFQYLRVPVLREFQDGLADQLVKLQFAAEGPRALRRALTVEGIEPSDEELLQAWSNATKFDWTASVTREEHVFNSIELAMNFGPVVANEYSWCVTRWQLRSLLTGDAPVLLVVPLGRPESSGVGFGTAGMILFAVSRRCQLLLINKTLGEAPDGWTRPGTVRSAREMNQMTVARAHRWIYHHPEDTLATLLGDEFPLPSPPETVIEDNTRDLRDALARAGEYHFQHPDEPHPFSGLPHVQPPPGCPTDSAIGE